jgi:hypothetical protein
VGDEMKPGPRVGRRRGTAAFEQDGGHESVLHGVLGDLA